MFGSNALPLPSPFAHERPLRLNGGEAQRPLPTGECRYLLLHPSAQNQRCPCQSFHFNRSAPGTNCECGHQACYHVHNDTHEKSTPPDAVNVLLDKINTLENKTKRLEETVQSERRNRENALHRERSMWEREVRILREALAPFYQSEKEMRRRMVEIEDRVEGNYDDHVRLRDRVVALDDAAMAVEKRVEELEGLRSKRRRVVRNHPADPPSLQDNYISSADDTFRRISSSNDGGSVHTPSSRALSPSGVPPPMPVEPQGPRSSGILNLVAEVPRPTAFLSLPQRLSPPQEEVRSSGFLRLDLDERLKERATEPPTQLLPRQAHAARITPPQDRPSPTTSIHSAMDRPPTASRTPPEPVNTKLPIVDVMVLSEQLSPRKRKHHLEHLALDVLADVTVASPLIH
jgi:hypothetical protein